MKSKSLQYFILFTNDALLANGFSNLVLYKRTCFKLKSYNDNYNNNDQDSNRWISVDNTYDPDWENQLQKRQDGSLWSSFVSSSEDEESNADDESSNKSNRIDIDPNLDDSEAWLDTIASVAVEEINFMEEDRDRADKLLQMQEWGFESSTIKSALNIAVDESLEIDKDNELFEKFKKETAKTGFSMYLDDDVDLTTVESHTTVEKDEDTGEPIRTQMVYVDEHTCIGCTHCAGVAQSTFFMEPYLGRARVFQQWGDDDETIQIAIETCPVDCIHYVPYDELVSLEIERRDQNINFKARLVNQGEYGGGTSQNVGTSVTFTGPQKISGNMGSRCNNCPSRGCADCPMYGVGKNPYFEAKEKARKEKMARRKLKAQMEDANRSAEL